MADTGVYFQEIFYTYEQLLQYRWEEEALQFCGDWLKGNAEFTVHTSGSTGTPKAIQLTRAKMEASALATKNRLQPNESDHILLSLNPVSIGGMMSLVRALEWKIPIHIYPPSAQPMELLSISHALTICSLVPLQLFDILKDPEAKAKLNRFRIVLLGGAALNAPLAEELQELKPVFYHSYGMTETCSHIALKQLNGTNKQAHFYPLEGVKIGLSQEETLVIDAPSAIERPLITNDLAQIHGDGSFDLLGRKDRSINSGGIKILLDEMDHYFAPLLSDYPYFCAGLEDDRLGQKLVVFIESEPFPHESLLQSLKALAPEYKAPKALIFAPRFLRTASGKIDRIKTSQQWAKTN